ncbi:MAG TPA: hypothetical protein P5110_00950 [Candidatus Omnitrophota bacterium]|nr:hypothetical protein [Candidatus Omnitrophota bacterium]
MDGVSLIVDAIKVAHIVILADINKVFATCRNLKTGKIQLFLIDRIYAEVYMFSNSSHIWQEVEDETAHQHVLSLVCDALQAARVPVYVLRGQSKNLESLLGM